MAAPSCIERWWQLSEAQRKHQQETIDPKVCRQEGATGWFDVHKDNSPSSPTFPQIFFFGTARELLGLSMKL